MKKALFVIVAIAFLVGIAQHVVAGSCSPETLGEITNDAREMLVTAAAQTDISEAQYYAKKAARELDLAWDAARECMSYNTNFISAANAAKKAEDNNYKPGFDEDIKAAIRHFNKALEALKVPSAYAIKEQESSLEIKPAAQSQSDVSSRGATNSSTGEYYPPSGSGVVNPRSGEFYPRSGNGYVNPRTGEFFPAK